MCECAWSRFPFWLTAVASAMVLVSGCGSGRTVAGAHGADATVDSAAPLSLSDGDISMKFRNLSSGGTWDWDVFHGKATCPAGQAISGLSVSTNDGQGSSAICRPGPGGLYTGDVTALLSVDQGDVQRATRFGDWAYGYFKLECGMGEYVQGVSEDAAQCQGDNAFHALLCSQGANLPTDSCSVRVFDHGDSRATVASGDWDPGFYKGECASDEYVAGISVDPSSRRPHSLLCCSRTPSRAACGKVGAQTLSSTQTFDNWSQSYCPRVAKWIGADFNSIRAFKQRCPGSKVVLRIWGPAAQYNSAQDLWNARYAPAIGNATQEQKALVDYLESDNECDAGHCHFSVAQAQDYARFLIDFVHIASQNGWRPLVGNFSVGNPGGDISSCDAEGMQRFAALLPAIQAAASVGGGWAYHAYTNNWVEDAWTATDTSLRYRRYVGCFPELANYPLILSEAGFDNGGDPNASGYAANGGAGTYLDWLRWWQAEIDKDGYVLGATLFIFSDDPGQWSSFRLDPIAADLGNLMNQCN